MLYLYLGSERRVRRATASEPMEAEINHYNTRLHSNVGRIRHTRHVHAAMNVHSLYEDIDLILFVAVLHVYVVLISGFAALMIRIRENSHKKLQQFAIVLFDVTFSRLQVVLTTTHRSTQPKSIVKPLTSGH